VPGRLVIVDLRGVTCRPGLRHEGLQGSLHRGRGVPSPVMGPMTRLGRKEGRRIGRGGSGINRRLLCEKHLVPDKPVGCRTARSHIVSEPSTKGFVKLFPLGPRCPGPLLPKLSKGHLRPRGITKGQAFCKQ